ncbi:MAG: metallophosphoesterase [Acutalibacteraceae bacterium]
MAVFFRKPKNKIIAVLIALLCLFIICDLFISNNLPTVSKYEISSEKVSKGFSFVFISDLHNKEFGKENKRLIEKIQKLNPDFVCLGGDFVNLDEKERDVAVEFFNNISRKHTCFMCLGNHETEYYDTSSLLKDIKSSGVTLLENEMVEYRTNSGEKITVGGLSEFPHNETDFWESDSKKFYRQFLQKNSGDEFCLLLCHFPTYFMYGFSKDKLDLMVSGHSHGGLIRIPFLGGVFSPDEGFAPKYDKGYFESGGSRMIVSAGLYNSNSFPRFNNPPDITFIKVK